jgi:hypothetical protein
MADETKFGTHWQDEELDAIVADYFAMLESDLAGQPYVKSRHSAALMDQIGRTHRSVEFKHQNSRPYWMNWACPGFPATSPSGTIRMRSIVTSAGCLDGPLVAV